MRVYLQISNDVDKTWLEVDGTTVAAFASDGECRGTATIMQGPVCKLFQLSVGVKSASESGFTLKVWEATSRKTYDLEGTLAANAELKIGGIKAPYAMTADIEESDPIPELEDPTAEEIKAVLDEADDEKLSERITNETEYVSFRTWSGTVKTSDGSAAAGAAGVMAAPNAWISYALGSDALIEEAPSDEDLEIEKFAVTGTKGAFDFEVSIQDVAVGSSATAANLSQIIGVIGATALDTNEFSAANVNVTFGTPADGKVKFSAGPKNADAPSFFMKVKVLP